MRLTSIAAALVATLLVVDGCSKDSPTGVSVNVSGQWGGTGKQDGQSISFLMTLTEGSGGSITGSGTVTTFTAGGSGLTYDVSGVRSGSSVTLSFVIQGFVSPIYKGDLTAANTMRGSIDGSGFNAMALRLDRM